MVIVTTPQPAAAAVAQRAAKMAERVNMEVVGVIENMSGFTATPGGPTIDLFGRGGGLRLAEQLGVPLLGEIPLDVNLREGGDVGQPIVKVNPESRRRRCCARLRANWSISCRSPRGLSGPGRHAASSFVAFSISAHIPALACSQDQKEARPKPSSAHCWRKVVMLCTGGVALLTVCPIPDEESGGDAHSRAPVERKFGAYAEPRVRGSP